MTDPLVGLSNPAIKLSNVVLPEPDLPVMARNSLALTSKFMSLSAVTEVSPVPKVLIRFRTEIIGSFFSVGSFGSPGSLCSPGSPSSVGSAGPLGSPGSVHSVGSFGRFGR